MTAPIPRAELAAALSARAITLAFQPQVDLGSGAIVGLEALARWTGAAGGGAPPGVFLPAFREAGLSRRLACALIEQAAQATAAAGVAIWVNLDLADALDPRLALEARALILDAGARLEDLVFEIAEDDLAALGESGWAAAERLRAAGLSLALDGRGAARIALDRRARALFCALKTGGPAMLAAARRLDVAPIAAAVRRLAAAHAAGMITVAVGAETAQSVRLLAALGFDCAQGDAIGPPAPLHESLRGAA